MLVSGLGLRPYFRVRVSNWPRQVG